MNSRRTRDAPARLASRRMRQLPLLLVIAGAGASGGGLYGANQRDDYTEHATRLHEHLLNGYNKAVAPKSVRHMNYSRAGTEVYLQVRFFKVDDVSPSTGQMRIKVWWRMSWSDLRLAWDPSEHGNVTEIKFFASDYTNPETTDIWLPDVAAYNAALGLMHSLEPAPASVRANGNVMWSRPGTLSVMCRFSGLVMFPYDRLSCPVLIGGWQTSGLTQGLLPGMLTKDAGVPSSTQCAVMNTPFSEEVSQSSYAEYVIDEVMCSTALLEYSSYPGEFWPVIRYRIFFSRSTSYYSLFALLPSIAMTLLSFTVFFMSFQVGERLGVGVTLVLMIEVAKVTMSSLIPVCAELLWIEIFYLANFYFTLGSLLESIIVLALAYQQSETLLPPSLDPRTWALAFTSDAVREAVLGTSFARARHRRARRKEAAALLDDESASSTMARFRQLSGLVTTSITAQMTPRWSKPADRVSKTDVVSIPNWEAQEVDAPPPIPAAAPPRAAKTPPASPPASPPEVTTPASVAAPAAESMAALDQGDVSRLIFFENLFFRLDVDGSSTISFDEMRRMLAFTALDMTSAEVDAALIDADAEDGDGELNRFEFLELCVKHLWRYPLAQLEAAATNFADFRLARQRRTNAKWQRAAHRIDQHSRFWFPASYAMVMSWIWALDLEDRYLGNTTDGAHVQQQPFLGAMEWPSTRWLIAIPVGFTLVTGVLSTLLFCALLPARQRLSARRSTASSQTVRSLAERSLKRKQAENRQSKRLSENGESMRRQCTRRLVKMNSSMNSRPKVLPNRCEPPPPSSPAPGTPQDPEEFAQRMDEWQRLAKAEKLTASPRRARFGEEEPGTSASPTARPRPASAR